MEVIATEDLMREHGLLNRILLIYQEIKQRIENDIDFPVETLYESAKIIRTFIEEYHEELEEKYIFTILEKHNKETELVKTLTHQHNEGRKVTKKIMEISSKNNLNRYDKKDIKFLLKEFLIMYRPHEAREDTVVFPLIHDLISKKEFEELGEKFEQIEKERFGEGGFNKMVEKVAEIEKKLGIHQLQQFTPKVY